MKDDPYGTPKDVSLREMIEVMGHMKDDETFRYFQDSYVTENGMVHPRVPTLRVTIGHVRKELMPLSPDQAVAKQMSTEQYDFEHHCKRIDEMLGDGERTYSCDELSGLVTEMIIRAYEGVGWNVKKAFDMRDGDYLTFSQKE